MTTRCTYCLSTRFLTNAIRNHFDVCFVRTYGLRLLDMFCHRNSTGTIRTSGIVMVIINSHVIHLPSASSFL